MQGSWFCPKEWSWFKARRGDMECRSPGISPAAKEGGSGHSPVLPCLLLSSQCNSRLQQRSGAFLVLEQGPAPGKHQSPVAQLFCSWRDPRAPNTTRLLQGAETEEARGAKQGMPRMLRMRP